MAVEQLSSGHWQLAAGGWQLSTGSWQLAVGSWQLAVDSWQLAVKQWAVAVGSRQPVAANPYNFIVEVAAGYRNLRGSPQISATCSLQVGRRTVASP